MGCCGASEENVTDFGSPLTITKAGVTMIFCNYWFNE